MQEMKRAIDKAREDMTVETSGLTGAHGELLAAAGKWATASLDCFSGELLRKAMLLAAAMAEFAHEAQNPL